MNLFFSLAQFQSISSMMGACHRNRERYDLLSTRGTCTRFRFVRIISIVLGSAIWKIGVFVEGNDDASCARPDSMGSVDFTAFAKLVGEREK